MLTLAIKSSLAGGCVAAVLAVLAMEPPEVCSSCGQPATTAYPDDDGEPSCGSAKCELRMQYARDYHDERGG